MAEERVITTTDNPYDPFTEWDQWYAWDERQGHHTSGLVARFTVTSEDLSVPDQEDAIDQAMVEIVESRMYGDYKFVYRKIEESA